MQTRGEALAAAPAARPDRAAALPGTSGRRCVVAAQRGLPRGRIATGSIGSEAYEKGLGGRTMDKRKAPHRLVAGLLAVFSLVGAVRAAEKPAALSLRALSSRPDMVSGGDALVEVRGAAKGVKLTLNGKDVSGDL